jgi:hypothetical protein
VLVVVFLANLTGDVLLILAGPGQFGIVDQMTEGLFCLADQNVLPGGRRFRHLDRFRFFVIGIFHAFRLSRRIEDDGERA